MLSVLRRLSRPKVPLEPYEVFLVADWCRAHVDKPDDDDSSLTQKVSLVTLSARTDLRYMEALMPNSSRWMLRYSTVQGKEPPGDSVKRDDSQGLHKKASRNSGVVGADAYVVEAEVASPQGHGGLGDLLVQRCLSIPSWLVKSCWGIGKAEEG